VILPLTVDQLLTTTRSVRRRLDLSKEVSPETIEECLRIAQQAPSASNMQQFHFVVVVDAEQRACLGDLFRRGLETYKDREDGLYRRRCDRLDEERRRKRIIESLEHLARHIHEVPVHVVPCVEGRLAVEPHAKIAALTASVIPATWSFMLAARSRGLGTCWSTLHLQFPEEADAVLGLPSGVTQIALVATAHSKGTTFQPAHRRPLDEILHWNRW
jgi:nitroreductase